MKTISFKVKINEELQKVISEDSRICSAMRRYAFNRLQDGIKQREIYQMIINKFDCNCHLANSALRNANALYTINKDKKVYFGKYLRFKKGLISKDELKESRDNGILSEGEMNQKGNRLFKIEVENNKFLYKRACKEHYDLIIVEKLSNKRKQVLSRLQILMTEKKIPVTIRLKKDIIYITYDEKIVENHRKFNNLFTNRVLGIDLNPNYFGISVIEFNHNDNFKIIHKEVIDVSILQTKSKDKIKYELYEINHRILRLCKQWHVGKLACEDLKFNNKKKFWNKGLNKLCKNNFRFNIIKTHLETLCNMFGVDFIEVNASYSSIIGNFIHGSNNCPDMVASSIEIARRAYKKFEKGWIYPRVINTQRYKEVLGNQWKEELELAYMSWKGLSGKIKESKLKYRFQLNPSNAVFSKTYLKKSIIVYNFL